MVFHWSLSNSKSSLVSKTLLSIRVNLNNTVVSARSPFFNSSSLFTKPLRIVPSEPIIIDITDFSMFHSFIIIIIIFILLFWEIFKPALADGLSVVSEWQQVSSSF